MTAPSRWVYIALGQGTFQREGISEAEDILLKRVALRVHWMLLFSIVCSVFCGQPITIQSSNNQSQR